MNEEDSKILEDKIRYALENALKIEEGKQYLFVFKRTALDAKNLEKFVTEMRDVFHIKALVLVLDDLNDMRVLTLEEKS